MATILFSGFALEVIIRHLKNTETRIEFDSIGIVVVQSSYLIEGDSS